MLRCLMQPTAGVGERKVNGIANKYGYMVNEEGEKVFDKIGEIDLQTDINSWLDTCDFAQIMSVIAPSVKDFDASDIIEMADFDTSDPIAVAAHIQQISEEFEYLPKEIKEKYGNNPRKFARSAIDGSFAREYTQKQQHDEPAQKVTQTVAEPSARPAAGNGGDFESLSARLEELANKIDGKGEKQE